MRKESITVNIWQGIIIILSIGMFYYLNNLSQGQIKFLLDLYKNAVEIFFGNWHWYNEYENYYVGSYYIISEKCLGINIIVLIFGLCGLLKIDNFKGFIRLLWILASAILAVTLGVFANIIRLLSSVYFTSYDKFETIHTMLGIVIYLALLIFCYVVLKKMMNTNGGDVNEENI